MKEETQSICVDIDDKKGFVYADTGSGRFVWAVIKDEIVWDAIHDLLTEHFLQSACDKIERGGKWKITLGKVRMNTSTFRHFEKAMNKKYEEKEEEEGDSWRTMEIKEMFSLLYDEVKELRDAEKIGSNSTVMEELVDVGNITRMIYERLRVSDAGTDKTRYSEEKAKEIVNTYLDSYSEDSEDLRPEKIVDIIMDGREVVIKYITVKGEHYMYYTGRKTVGGSRQTGFASYPVGEEK